MPITYSSGTSSFRVREPRQTNIPVYIAGGDNRSSGTTSGTGLTIAQEDQLATDILRGENLGFIDPAAPSSATLTSQNAADYFYNTADSNSLYRATAAGQGVGAFTKVVVPGTTGTIIGEAATYAALPAVVNGQYAMLTATDGTRIKGIYKGVGGAWVQNAIAGVSISSTPASETVVLANLPADTWTDVPAGTQVTAPLFIDTLDASGNAIDINARLVGGKWRVISSVAMTNVQIILWS